MKTYGDAIRKGKILTSRFFNRPTLAVAQELLGKFLVRQLPPAADRRGHKKARANAERILAGMITEAEAYVGPEDRASHAWRGERTRNRVMFKKPGIWYVYFTYGMHWMLNIVTEREGYPAAVLIRGINEIYGPARLTKFLKIDGRFNGKPAIRGTGLWIEDRGIKIKTSQINRGKRIGIDYAGNWKNKRWRFYI